VTARRRPRRQPADAGYPPDESVGGRLVDARAHLLDRQVHDVDGVPVTAVDDLELVEGRAGAAPTVAALLSGSILNTRLLGGHQPEPRWGRIPWSSVAKVGVVIELSVRGEDLDVTWTERWLREHLIGRIPGGQHDPE